MRDDTVTQPARLTRGEGASGSWSTRGVVLGAGGLSAAVAAAVLGEPDLLRLGVFVLMLPVLSLAWTVLVVERGVRHLAAVRSAHPDQVSSGTPVTVRLTLRRTAHGSGTLLAEDLLPPGVSRRAAPPRLALGPGRSEADTTYTLVPLRRGTLSLGPTMVRPASPLGLCDRRVVLSGETSVVVTPRVVNLPPTPMLRQPRGLGDHRPRRPGTAPAEDASLRPYQRGDDLRLVHWRSTARRGELQVREGVDLRIPRSVLLLDDLGTAGGGFEGAVDVAASVGVHLLGLEHDLDLVVLGTGQSRRCRSSLDLLGHLAEAEARDSTPARSSGQSSGRSSGRGTSGTRGPAALRVGSGDVLVLCTSVDTDPAALVASLPVRPGRSPAVAVVVGPLDGREGRDAGRDAGRAGRAGATSQDLEDLLVARGWIVRTVPSVTDLPGVWAQDTSRALAVAGGGR